MGRKTKKVLHLILKHEWYQMIESGEKTEEYRDVKDYYLDRLAGGDENLKNQMVLADIAACANHEEIDITDGTEFTHLCFHRGYTGIDMAFKIQKITIGMGREKWGAPADRPVIIFHLGERDDLR